MSKYVAGYCDKKRRRILLEAFPFPKGEGILLHEMAHIATNVHHGPRFRQEMTRLAALDAPLGSDQPRCLCDGWGVVICLVG